MKTPRKHKKSAPQPGPEAAPVAAEVKPVVAEVAADEPEPDEPQPEPWTPERVTEWNSYYDHYVILGALLLAFIASSNRIVHSSIWNQIQTGRVIAARGAPVLSDPFSYTEPGAPWVNIPWLFDWGHAALFKGAFDMTPPVDVPGSPASIARAEQVASAAMVALNALARLLTAVVLMRIRHAGPGRWWSAVCATLAVGAVVSPIQWLPALGGIAGPGLVSPATWGLLLTAVELWLLHRAFALGDRRSAYALVPLFVLWANVDDSFVVGLLLLTAAALGRVRPPAGEGAGLSTAVGVLAASAVACLANPSTFHIYGVAVEPYLGMFRPAGEAGTVDQLSMFGKELRGQLGASWVLFAVNYVALVAVGLGSFALNRRRFVLGRFLVFATAAVLWGLLIRFSPEFALVFAATLTLNGQEWYHDRFGTEGRVGTGWSLWSVGGRAVTIVVLFACVARALTGYGLSYGEAQFGFGFDPDEFEFEAASFLKDAPFRGNVLNTTSSQGDALIWRATPERKTYVDSRPHLFPRALREQLRQTRLALSTDDEAVWKPFLDEYKIVAVMIQPSEARKTYRVLSQSPAWVPFYDNGAVALFGRADAPEADRAFFRANRLDAETLAYRRSKVVPTPERPPSPVSWMDTVFQTRPLTKPQPHTEAAQRWLSGPEADTDAPADVSLPDPARCLVAIREARTALASKPDDPQAYRLLARAYTALTVQEFALLSGLTLNPQDLQRVAAASSRPDVLGTRFRERVTALNYAIQTTPPPKNPHDRRVLQSLNYDLHELFMAANYVDLARDRLKAVLEKSEPADFPAEFRTGLVQQLGRLDEGVKQVQARMTDLSAEQQPGPLQLATYALGQGAPGLAIRELEEAERTGTNPALVKPRLLDLYCETGQPEKALDMLGGSSSVDDPSFGTEPGTSAMRQSRVYFLLGNTDNAGTLWEKYALPRLRYDRGLRALASAQSLVKGEPKAASGFFLEIPEKVRLQAGWEFEAGLCRLEGGMPELAAEHFAKTLTLAPDLNLRPVIAYYLEKLGKPVPPKAGEPVKAVEKPKPAEGDRPKDAEKPKEGDPPK